LDATTTATLAKASTPSALTGGRLLAGNAAWNLATQCAPMAVAVVTVPVLIAGIGTERFGILTLAWIVLGYFSLFDFGLGRALTKLVAEKLGLGEGASIPPLVGTALVLMTALGLVGALFVGLISPWLVRDALKISGPLRHESLQAFRLMAAMLPFVIGLSGLRGVMEAHQRFRSINLVRMAAGLFTLVGPLMVLPFTRSLVAVVAVIAAGKLASWLAHVVLCLRTVPGLRRGFAPRAGLVRSLVSFGGWMTVANVINPVMVQMDRFLIGAMLSTAAVAYYTTPFELTTKFWYLSNAVLGVMFPAFATSFVRDRGLTARIFGKCLKYVFLMLFPLVLITVSLADGLLAVWLGAEFARQSTLVLQCLAVGVFLNGLAQVASALLQGVGRPGVTAVLHLVELPLYLAAAWFLIGARGIEGAALAWTGRTALDLVLFLGAAVWVLPGCVAAVRRLALGLGLALPVIAVCALPAGFAARGVLLLPVVAVSSFVTWRFVVAPEEKAAILGVLAPALGRGGVTSSGVPAPGEAGLAAPFIG
jgi:O-antigen/teichoic acid export membrane protein